MGLAKDQPITSNELRLFKTYSTYGNNDVVVARGLRFHGEFFDMMHTIRNSYIVICMQGHARFVINDLETTLERGGIVILLPNSRLRILDITANFDIHVMGVSLEYTHHGYLRKTLPLGAIIVFLTQQHSLRLSDDEIRFLSENIKLLRRGILAEDHGFKAEVMNHLVSSLMSSLSGIISHYLGVQPVGMHRSAQTFSNFANLVTKHFKAHRELTFYAQQLHVTCKYLSVVTSKVTGYTASRLIELVIVNEAKSLLRASHYNINQIAEELGFPGASSFGKYFRKATGQSPSEYRSR